MKKIIFLAALLIPSVFFAQEMEKKEREPIFVLPDVVITGESEIKVGGEKKELLPENYPLPPKETPLMELQFIKGPYLDNGKGSAPELGENRKSSARLVELLGACGSFSSLYGKLIYGETFGRYSLLLKAEKDSRRCQVTDNGYDAGTLNLDVSASFEKSLDAAISLIYKNGSAFRTSPSLAYSSDEYRDDLVEADIALSGSSSEGLKLKGGMKAARTTLEKIGYADNFLAVFAGGDFRITGRDNTILGSVNAELRTDSLFGQLYSVSAAAKFNLNPVLLNAGIRYDQIRLNPSVSASADIDGNTTVYASYSPGLLFPRASELFAQRPMDVPASLNSENDWFSLTTGLQHKITNDLPVSLEIFRREVENLITYETEAAPVPDILRPVNIAGVSVAGMNFNESWKLSSNFTQSLKYTFMSTLNGLPGRFVPYMPQHALLLRGEYADSGWNFTATFEYKSEMNYSETNSGTVPGRLLAGLKLSKELSGWLTVFIAGDNLLNQNAEIIKDRALTGAFLSAGLDVKL